MNGAPVTPCPSSACSTTAAISSKPRFSCRACSPRGSTFTATSRSRAGPLPAASRGSGNPSSGTGTARPASDFIYWHWSHEWAYQIHHPLIGFNEVMITYLLAIASPTHGVPAGMYYSGWAIAIRTRQPYREGWSGSADGRSLRQRPHLLRNQARRRRRYAAARCSSPTTRTWASIRTACTTASRLRTSRTIATSR